jgi:hypothetical protein
VLLHSFVRYAILLQSTEDRLGLLGLADRPAAFLRSRRRSRSKRRRRRSRRSRSRRSRRRRSKRRNVVSV